MKRRATDQNVVWHKTELRPLSLDRFQKTETLWRVIVIDMNNVMIKIAILSLIMRFVFQYVFSLYVIFSQSIVKVKMISHQNLQIFHNCGLGWLIYSCMSHGRNLARYGMTSS